jgi:hypothetical protein
MTEGSSRAFRIASHLPMYGWEPIVLAPPDFLPHVASVSGENGVKVYRTGEPISVESLDQYALAAFVRGERAPASGLVAKVFAGRTQADHPLSSWEEEAGALAETIMKEHQGIEAIYAQGPPVAPLALAVELSKKCSIPALFDLVAPLDSPFQFSGLTGMRQSELSKFEERLLTTGYTVITPNRPLKEYFLKKYHGRTAHAEISIVPDFCHPFRTESRSIYSTGGNGRGFSVLLFLERVDGNDLKKFFSSLSGFRAGYIAASGHPEFIIVSRDRELTMKYVKKYRLEHAVELRCTISEEEELELCMKADAVGMIIGQHELNPLWLPQRLVDAAGMKKALFLAAPDGAAKQFCIESNGLSLSAGSSSAATEMFQTLSAQWSDGALLTADQELLSRYCVDRTLGDLAKIIAFMLPV